jgi:cell division protein YceG involved in septum cleavage
MEKIRLNKKSLLYLGIIFIIVLLVSVGLFFYFSKKNSETEIIIEREDFVKSLTIPAGAPIPLPKETLENLAIPAGKPVKLSESALKNLTIPK